MGCDGGPGFLAKIPCLQKPHGRETNPPGDKGCSGEVLRLSSRPRAGNGGIPPAKNEQSQTS